jgi:hypothetical protein
MADSPRIAFLRKEHGPVFRGYHRFARRAETSDSYLELIRVLSEGAALEHSLMIAYLFSMFSIKNRHSRVRGDVTPDLFMEHRIGGQPEEPTADADHSWLAVCTEEMQHLSLANGLLGELGAAPNLMPHQWPLPADIYPFELDLASLSRRQVAKFLWIEADDTALDPAAHVGDPGEQRFIAEVLRLLPRHPKRPGHVGSVYRRVLDLLEKTATTKPPILSSDFPYHAWYDRVKALQQQGEIAHFTFFRRQFTGKAFGGNADIWRPGPDYPARELFRGTAFPRYQDTIPDPDARRVAWLANLHYWILLMLLDASYHDRDRGPRYQAIEGMTQCLWHLGLTLAERWGTGLPFDRLGRNYGVGRDRAAALAIIRGYAVEAKAAVEALDADGLLPPSYDRLVLPALIDALGADLVPIPYHAVLE